MIGLQSTSRIYSNITMFGNLAANLITYLTAHLYLCSAFKGFRLSAKPVELATVAGQKTTLSESVSWIIFPLVSVWFLFFSFFMCLSIDINRSLFLCFLMCVFVSNSFCCMHCISTVSSQLCMCVVTFKKDYFLAYLRHIFLVYYIHY